MGIGSNRSYSRNFQITSELNLNTKLYYYRMEITNGKINRKAMLSQILFDGICHYIVDPLEEPAAAQNPKVCISMIATEMQPRCLRQKYDVPVKKAFLLNA